MYCFIFGKRQMCSNYTILMDLIFCGDRRAFAERRAAFMSQRIAIIQAILRFILHDIFCAFDFYLPYKLCAQSTVTEPAWSRASLRAPASSSKANLDKPKEQAVTVPSTRTKPSTSAMLESEVNSGSALPACADSELPRRGTVLSARMVFLLFF